MSRPATKAIGEPSNIRPAAAPVDTYVRPPDPAPSTLHQVAEGLAAFDKGLSGFLNKRRGDQNEADRIRGEAAFNKANQVGWSEAVKRGLVPAHASPIFQQSYKKAQGNLAGIKLREKFTQQYLSWEGRNSDDPAAFDTFYQDFLSENIRTEDPHVLAGLNPHVQSLTDQAYSVRSNEVSKSTYNGHVNTQAALAGEEIDYANQDGLTTGEGTDYVGLRASLIAQRDEVLQTGVRQEDYDATLVDTIVAKAIEHQDPQLLDVLDEIFPGHEVKLSSIPEFRDKKQTAIENIEIDIRQRMSANAKEQEDADKRAEAAIVKSVFAALDENPLIEVPEDIIRQWEKYDPHARTKLARARRTLQDADELESRDDLLMIEQMIQDGATNKDIFDLVSDGIISNPLTLKNVLDRVEKRRKAVLEGDGILRTQTSRRFLNTIKERTLPNEYEQLFAPEGFSDEGLEATKDFEMMLIRWEEENPQASLLEREKAINEVGELILGRIEKEVEGKIGPQYISELDTALPKQEEEAANPEANIENSAASDQQVEKSDTNFWSLPSKEEFKKVMRIDAGIGIPREKDVERREAWEQQQIEEHFTGDKPPVLSEIHPVFREKLEADAERLDMSLEEYAQEIWERLKAVEGQEPKEAEVVEGNLVQGAFQPEEVEDDIAKAIDTAVLDGATSTESATNDLKIRKASPILDLIGNTEGTDRGRGYNETLEYGRFTGGDVELVNMTLAEVDELQTQMLKHPANNLNSSALGRYQIVRKNLRSLKKQMGLKDTDKFTPELQDQMALKLLHGRGYQKWLDGKLSDKRFMTSIAKEWASLPTSSGHGYYSGQRVGASPNDVMGAFKYVLNDKVGLPGSNGEAVDAEGLDLKVIHTANDRGYDPDMDKVKDDVKSKLLATQQSFGSALKVVSGYRDPARNARAGGAKKSMHTVGQAVDITVRNMPLEERKRLIRAATEAGFTGIGVYANSLHFDTGDRRYWGPSHSSSSLPDWASEVISEHMNKNS